MRVLCLVLLLSSCGGAVSADEPLIPAFTDHPAKIIYLDEDGHRALETDYTQGEFFEDGLARVCNERCGYIDTDGEQRFGFDFDWIGYRSEGYISYCKESKCGFLDLQGNVVIPPEFEDVQNYSEGLAAAKKNGLWGFIDKKGNWSISPRYGSVLPFSENRASVQDPKPPHLFGIIDNRGRVVLKFKHQKIFPFSGGQARFFHWDRFGYLNPSGTMELPASLEWAQDPVSGLSYFVHENTQGFRLGAETVLSLGCPGGSDFSAQEPVVALVQNCQSGLFQYIDGKGKVWKGGYEEATRFRNGFALARKKGEKHFLLINAKGKEYPVEGIRPAW